MIHDHRITAIEPGFLAQAGAEIIDLSHSTVMPGFIDCHVHVAAKLPSRTNAIGRLMAYRQRHDA